MLPSCASAAACTRVVDQAFAHGRVTNYWGGTSNASTHLLDGMHYRGLLRVQRRDSGTRIYAVAEHAEPDASEQAQVERRRPDRPGGAQVRAAALGQPDLSGAPAGLWRPHIWPSRPGERWRWPSATTGQLHAGGTTWYWPADENPRSRHAPDEQVRLLAPFDPVVWDRRRFELLWGWVYKFEAYACTEAPVWLLRTAGVVARPGGGLGQSQRARG